VRADIATSDLDVVAPEDTFFVGQDAHGRRFYSRNGDFSLADGTLRTQNGSLIMGYPAGGRTDTLAPLRQDPVDLATRRGSDARIDTDGTLSYTRRVVDPKTGIAKPERVVVGRIALARFPAATELVSPDGVHMTAPADITPSIGVPADHGPAALLLRRTDRGAYNVKEGINELRDAYVAFDGLRATNTARTNFAKTATGLIK
jgi:flagellar basal body rod protein FlgG